MFYSRTVLARKSPLGTVWIAAHLARRINRPQIESIHISFFAEKIMMPDVPIALRLSGHLLLGLVRIYSWKVNHLFLDCNRLVTDMRKAFASVPVDLHKEAGPFEPVALTETFDLNALELGDMQNMDNQPDKHIKPCSMITMLDQIPVEGEQYGALSLSEDTMLNPSPRPTNRLNSPPGQGNVFNLSPRSIDELNLSPQPAHPPPMSMQLDEELPPFENPLELVICLTEPATITDNVVNNIEIMLDDSDHHSQDVVTPGDIHTGGRLSSMISQRHLSTVPEEITITEVGSSSRVEMLETILENRIIVPDLKASSGKCSVVLNLESESPVKRKVVKKRKRGQAFDKQLVLKNEQMKRQLDDSSSIVCTRRKLPCTKLDVWKHHKFLRKEDFLAGPLFSGMSTFLTEIIEKTYPRLPNVSTVESTSPLEGTFDPSIHEKETGPTVVEAQNMATPILDAYSEHIERARDANNVEDLTPQFAVVNGSDFGLNFPKEQDSETGLKQATEIPSSAEPLRFNLESPIHLEEQRLDEMEIPDAPGLLDSSGDLNILDVDSTPQGHLDAFQGESMSARTRAVAKYLKDNSLVDQLDSSGHISLNKLLEQRNRKQCSRLFFEILVLKSNGFINVEQKESYGDILLSPTPELQYAKF